MAIANIKDFINTFSKTEVSRPCNFTVSIIPTKSINATVEKNLIFRCETAELPGRTFSLVDQKTYGPIEQYPIQSAYNKSNMVFICSDTMEEKIYFDDWMNRISYSTPTYSKTPSAAVSISVKFDFEYKVNYFADVMINQHDVTGKIIYRAVLVEAFPVECHSIGLNWSQFNDYNRLNVTFAYRYAYGETNPAKLNLQ